MKQEQEIPKMLRCFLLYQNLWGCVTATRTACAPSSSVCPPGSASSSAWGVTETLREPSLTWWTPGNIPPPFLSSPSLHSTPHTEVRHTNMRWHTGQIALLWNTTPAKGKSFCQKSAQATVIVCCFCRNTTTWRWLLSVFHWIVCAQQPEGTLSLNATGWPWFPCWFLELL